MLFQVGNGRISYFEEKNIRLRALLEKTLWIILKVFLTFWLYKFSFGNQPFCQKYNLWMHMYPRKPLVGGFMGYQWHGIIKGWFLFKNLVYLLIRNSLIFCLGCKLNKAQKVKLFNSTFKCDPKYAIYTQINTKIIPQKRFFLVFISEFARCFVKQLSKVTFS